MAEPTPFALRRMLALRQFPILRDAELGELALLAENVTEVVLPAGTAVATPGRRLAALYLVVAGEIATTGSSPRSWRTQQVFGGLEVLADHIASQAAVAVVPTTALQLLAPDVSDVLEDSFGVMLAALRGLAAQVRLRAPGPLDAPPVPSSLGLVERLIVLRRQIAFSRAPLEALVALAHASDEISVAPGGVLAQTGTTATSSYVIVEGTARAGDAAGSARMLGPGDAIGHLEALGNLAHRETIAVVSPLRALAVESPRLFDVLEDHADFGRAILAVLAGALLDAPAVTTG